MIRHGKLCRDCNNQCKDLGTDTEPIEIECPSCHGDGCTRCEAGMIRITGCPNDHARCMSSTIHLIELFGKGVLPVSGGALDQSAWFLSAERCYRIEEALLRSESDV